jgi:RNA polymerase-binding transcription factor
VPAVRPASAIRSQLVQQRRLRLQQLEELGLDAAEAHAADDEPRLQVIGGLALAAESALSEIDAALKRLEEGSYGTCESCAEPIPWQRLEVLPMTRLCIPCQYLAESGRSRRSRGAQARSGSGIR